MKAEEYREVAKAYRKFRAAVKKAHDELLGELEGSGVRGVEKLTHKLLDKAAMRAAGIDDIADDYDSKD